MPEKTFLTWEQIRRLSEDLARRIALMSPDLSKVTLVAVSRGGLIPTQLIAYRLGIKDIRLLKLASYREDNQRGDMVDFSTDQIPSGENVYFIDDVADSGATAAYIRQHFPKSRIGTLASKTCCAEQPDLCAMTEFSADEWIVFPWD
jgi:xanthine phosphoribosyltransferase